MTEKGQYGNVVPFRLRARPGRDQAKRWLASNIDSFPEHLPNGYGDELFHGWRFIRSTVGYIYFANCIDPGIGEDEFMKEKASG